MLQVNKIEELPDWSFTFEINRWCDYVELRCLINDDQLVTKSDVVSWLTEGKKTGDEEHSKLSDKISSEVDVLFEQIKFRSINVPEFYPFVYEDEGISICSELDDYKKQYLFLLFVSSYSFFDRSSATLLATAFEKYCLNIFRFLVADDSETHIFGTSRQSQIFCGNLRKRIETLATCFGAETTKTFDNDTQYDVPGGDEGIDLIAFNKLDQATHIPVAIAQCTCSYGEWETKQGDIDQDRWTRKMQPLAPMGRFMFVSFFCRNAVGKFENPTTITTCLIDRLRILIIIRKHSEEIFKKIDINQQDTVINTYCSNCNISSLYVIQQSDF